MKIPENYSSGEAGAHEEPSSGSMTSGESASQSNDTNERSDSEDYTDIRKRITEFLESRYSCEPADFITLEEFKQSYENDVPIAFCMLLLLHITAFNSFIHVNDFSPDEQPYLSLFKCVAENINDALSTVEAKFKTLKCKRRNFGDFNEIMEFVIKRSVREDTEISTILRNDVVVKSRRNPAPNNIFSVCFGSYTINFNAIADRDVPKDSSIEQICDLLLKDSARKVRTLRPLEESNQRFFICTDYNDSIIVTTDRYRQNMRDAGKSHKSELIFKNEGSEESKYKVKFILCQSMGEHGFFPFPVDVLQVFDKKTKKDWVKKMLTTAVLILYERVRT
ncbi:hypothetical protein ENBRE01_1575 [Enteropsectra breve]|nr:hypothetical protein ENBRE01_1575 [Enteropsectra breve]